MIDWIDANEKLPEKSGGYLVWYGNEKSDVYTGSAQIYYSVVHGLWNCHDFSPDKSNAITGIKYWAKINTPYDCKRKIVPMSKKQRDLIDSMNEFCREKFEYSDKTTKKEASEYIDRNIDEFKLATMDDWSLKYL